MQPAQIPDGFGPALLFELDIAERQLLALANAIPMEKYGWCPAESARSVSEVLVHIAAGNFFPLQLAAHDPAPDLYGHITSQGEERVSAVVKQNDVLEKTITGKDAVVTLLTRALHAVREAITNGDEATLAQPVMRRLYMRMIAHTHEHMGQMIAYTRMMGMPVPWPDWRPDKR